LPGVPRLIHRTLLHFSMSKVRGIAGSGDC
jgi:hypothetical protein